MGANNKSSVNKNFYNVKDHAFRKNVKEKSETSKEEKSKDGTKTYYYEEYRELNGFLRQLTTWKEDIETKGVKKEVIKFSIDLKDTEGNYECVQMFLNSQAADTFLKRLPNIDLTKEVVIRISKQTSEDKTATFDLITVYQNDTQFKKKDDDKLDLIPYYWKKDEVTKKLNGTLPELKEVEVNGAKIKDRTERMNYYEKMSNFYNAQIADINKAIYKDGVQPEELVKFKAEHSDYGSFINYVKS